jgi:hypothetical protein
MDIINFLPAKPDEKLGKHEGLFTRSYQEARAVYDAKIRSWGIEYQDNLFSSKKTTKMLLKKFILMKECKIAPVRTLLKFKAGHACILKLSDYWI